MRRGKFGRSRQGSPSLTALIASLMREQKQAEDRAVFDAYANGGTYKGKPVTDSAMLSYIKERRNGFDRTDPLWDEWNNRATQQEFKIGEEKIGLSFKQGHVSAGAVAAWYRGQLSKLPKDSAFYREVAGRAADWAKAAGGAARGRARGGVTKALNAKLAKLGETTANYEALTNGLEDIARRAGFIEGNQTLTDATASHIEQLFGMGITFGGHPVTLESWHKAAVARYGVFDATIAAYKQAGRKVPKSLLTQKGAFLDRTLVRLNAVDDRAKYELARDNWTQAVSASGNDPNAVLSATQSYIDTLRNIRDVALRPGGSQTNDPELIGGLANEITALVTGKASGPTVTDIQSNTGEGVVTTDAEKLAAASAKYTTEYTDLHSGKAYYGQGEKGDELGVHPYPVGAQFDPTGRHGLPEQYQAVLTTVDGATKAVVLRGTPVNGGAILDANGMPVSSKLTPDQIASNLATGAFAVQAGDKPLGYVFTNPIDGSTNYAVKTPEGSLVFTAANPFTGLTNDGHGGLLVDTGQWRAGIDQKPDFLPGAGLLPTFNGRTAAPVLVDSTVPPDDISKFYDTSNPAMAAFLDERTKAAQAAARGERAAAESFLGTSTRGLSHLPNEGDLGLGLSDALTSGAAGPLGQMLGQGLGALGDALRTVTLPSPPPPFNTGAPPKPLGLPPVSVEPPLSGKAADDLVLPPPPVVTPPAGGGGKAGASKPGYTSPSAPAPTPSYTPNRQR